MEKQQVISSYETMFIVSLEAGETGIRATIDKFTGLISSQAELVEVTEWGKRRFAYPINDKPEGYYVLATFKSTPEFPVELDRNFNIDEAVMRSMIVKLDYEAVKHEKPVVAEEVSFKSEDATAEPVAEVAEPAVEVAEPAVEVAEPAVEVEAVAERVEAEPVAETETKAE